ncbi:MAG: hypothetical protein RL456_2581 [Pseudomonadota bacterium]
MAAPGLDVKIHIFPQALPDRSTLISRWIHARAVVALLLLPWLALALAAAGFVAADLWAGDAIARLDWARLPRRPVVEQALADLPWLIGGAYLAGLPPWLAGLMLGGRATSHAVSLLGALGGVLGVTVGLQAGLQIGQAGLWMLALVTGVVWGLYALLTLRPVPVPPRLAPRPRIEPVELPPAPPPMPRVVAPAPIPTLHRHDAPTTLPAEL